MSGKTAAILLSGALVTGTMTTLLVTNPPETKSSIKTALQATATEVSQNASLPEALTAELQAENVTLREWNTEAREHNDTRSKYTFWFAAKVLPPTVVGNRILGTCEAGTCTVKPSVQRAEAARWSFEIVAEYGDWRIARVTASPYFAAGLKSWSDSSADAHWLGSPSQVKQECLARFTAAQCKAMLVETSDCWALFDGDELERTCRYGINGSLPGTHDDLGQPCSPDDGQGWVPIDCVTKKGAGGAVQDALRNWDLSQE